MSHIDELFPLKGVSAVVTGGARVLPSAMSVALAKAGAGVTVRGRGTSHPVDEAVKSIRDESGAGDRVHGITVDTGDEDAVSAPFEQTCLHAPMPNLLVNGVGGNLGKSDFVDIDVDQFRSVLDMNLLGGFVIPTKIFAAKWFQEKKRAGIINIGSMSRYNPLSGVWAYDAAKPDDSTGELTDRGKQISGKQIIGKTPAGRSGDFADIEGVTVYLASERASGFGTGVTIPVDGGYLTDNV